MKKILVLLMCIVSSSCFAFVSTSEHSSTAACQVVDPWPSTKPGFDIKVFCDQFEEAAYCHCANQAGLPYDFCKFTLQMKGIYKRMMDRYHNFETACEHQGDGGILKQDCIDQWNYYAASFCKKI